jgi:hypothetical protein
MGLSMFAMMCPFTILGARRVGRERLSGRVDWYPLIPLSFMSSSLGSTAFVIFAVLSVVTLKELNVQVTEPYMVCFPLSALRYDMISSFLRTSRFMSPRSRHTATGTGPTGIRKSRHLPDCENVGF